VSALKIGEISGSFSRGVGLASPVSPDRLGVVHTLMTREALALQGTSRSVAAEARTFQCASAASLQDRSHHGSVLE
jgi:hypothetical protein